MDDNRNEALRLLNLGPGATTAEIRQSYCDLAKKYHPDHNPDKIAHDMFIQIDRAYKALTSNSAYVPLAASSHVDPTPAAKKQKMDNATSDYLQKVLAEIGDGWFERPLCKFTNCRDLQDACEKNGIGLTVLSERSHRPIKRNKTQLFTMLKKSPLYIELSHKSYQQLETLCHTRGIAIPDKATDIALIIQLMKNPTVKT